MQCVGIDVSGGGVLLDDRVQQIERLVPSPLLEGSQGLGMDGGEELAGPFAPDRAIRMPTWSKYVRIPGVSVRSLAGRVRVAELGNAKSMAS